MFVLLFLNFGKILIQNYVIEFKTVFNDVGYFWSFVIISYSQQQTWLFEVHHKIASKKFGNVLFFLAGNVEK